MPQVNPVTMEMATPPLKETYNGLQKKLGKLLNIYATLGNSPIVLEGLLGMEGIAAKTSLNAKLREEIALVVAETNQCKYCLAAHSTIGGLVGLKNEDILGARKGQAQDSKTAAILKFAKLVVEKKGHVADSDLQTLRAANVNDKELVEIIFVIILNMFTNYFNIITDPEVDFPTPPKLN